MKAKAAVKAEAEEAAAVKRKAKAEAEEAAAVKRKAKAAKRRAAEEAATAHRKAAADREEQRKQRHQYLKEKKAAQGKLSGAESTEYMKMQNTINVKKRRKAEPPATEIRISKMKRIK